MADLDAIYNAYNEITDAKDRASEHLDAYLTIISASQGSEGAKRLAGQFIPIFFKNFPTLHTKAIDGVFDLCEDDSSVIRQAAIKSLPLLCKDGPQHTIKIADVLCQLLQLDDQDLIVVQAALQTLMLQNPRDVITVIFQQGVKGADLRERTLDFITNQVMATKDTLFKDPEVELFFLMEMQKAMGSVSNAELEIFAKITMQTKSYQTGKLDLTGLLNAYIFHITSGRPFDVNDEESVKRLLVAGKLSMPLFKRTISADPLLEFFATNVLPRSSFDRLTDKQKTSALRLHADSMIVGHPSPTILKSTGGQLTDLLVAIVPAEQESTAQVEFPQVECITNVLYYIATTKGPEVLEKEELTSRFRNLYMLTQNQISGLKQSLTAAQAKKPQDAEQAAVIKNLTKALITLTNIHTAVKEFMKPKHLRSTKLVLHPSWQPVPEPAKPNAPKTSGLAKSTSAGPSKPAVGVIKPAARANTKPGARPTVATQQPQQQQQQQAGSNKRKADQEPSVKPKKPKIDRRHGSNTGSNSPGNSSPSGGQGNKGQKQTQQQQQQHSQQTQSGQHGSHGKRSSGSFNGGAGGMGRGQTDGRRAREDRDKGRISFLQR